MSTKNETKPLVKYTLVAGSILLGLGTFTVFDMVYSKLDKRDPFSLPALKSNGISLYKGGAKGWYELNPNFSGEDRYGKLTFSVNTDRHGFRTGSRRSSTAQPASKPSIVLFGDSFTYGVGTEWRETYGDQLSQLLNTPVMNAGVNSHSPTAYTHRLKKLLEANVIPPKAIIIMGIDISDVQDEATRWRDGTPTPIDITHQASNQEATPPFYSPQNFKLSHHIYYFFEGLVKYYTDNFFLHYHRRSAFTHRPWQSLNRFYSPIGVSGGMNRIKQKINEAAVLSRQHNHPFYLLIYPWPAQLSQPDRFRWDQAIDSACKPPACNGTINTIPRFKALKETNKNWQTTYYIFGDMHFNAKGNRVIAESIGDKLKKDGRL